MKLTIKEEILLARNAYMVTKRVIENQGPSEDRLKSIKKLMPELYEILEGISYEELIEVLTKYKDHQFFKKDIKIALSTKGRNVIKQGLQIINNLSSENGSRLK